MADTTSDLPESQQSGGLLQAYLGTNKWILFLLWLALNVLVIFANRNYLYTDSVYYNTYGEKVALERIDNFLEIRERFAWLAYAFIPLTMLFKLTLITLSINTGTLLAEVKLGFKRIFGMVVALELVFVIAHLSRVMWLAFVVDAAHMDQINYFHPLSLINFFDANSLPSWLIYPIHLLNLFELGYILLLGAGVRVHTGMSYGRSLALVGSSYGLGLLVWATLISLLSISLS